MEEHRLIVFENRMLRRIYGSHKGEVTGDLRTPHNEQFHNLFSSLYIMKRSNQGGGDGRGVFYACER
jgi:hypothetical protein